MSLELKDLDLLRDSSYINGVWEPSACKEPSAHKEPSTSADHVVVTNPANGEEIAKISTVGQSETKRAIESAQAALPSWRSKTAKERAGLLRNLHGLMMSHQEDLARILTAEQGKPLAEARAEIAYSASYIEWFAEEAKRIYGDTISASDSNKRLMVIKQGIGVVACITPWNFPSAMLGRKIAPALAAGCTVVCKPAAQTPLSALAIAVLADRAGIPAGVINILVGSASDIGRELTSNPLVRKLTFTGSTPVGKRLMRDCADTVKRTSMELGGNAPFIVFEDADLDAAVEGAIASKYRNAGQTCVCSNRLMVQDSIYDAFVEKLAVAVRQIKLGDGQNPDVTMGPLVDAQAASDVRDLVDDAIAKGASSMTGDDSSNLGPAFVSPTILTDLTKDMRVFREEIFGPVAPIFSFRTEQEAVQMANDTEFGLAAYFYTRDLGRIWRMAEGLEYGIVGINEGSVSSELAPFGGMKESGNGREGSKYGLDDYTELKYLCMGGIQSTAPIAA